MLHHVLSVGRSKTKKEWPQIEMNWLTRLTQTDSLVVHENCVGQLSSLSQTFSALQLQKYFSRLSLLHGQSFKKVFGDGSVAQSVLSGGNAGNFFAINWGFGVAVMCGVYVSGGVSGGHINPAVTLAMALAKKLSWKKVPAYFLAQYAGAFTAAAVVYAVYYDALVLHAGDVRSVLGENATANIWATYPTEGISQGVGFLDQIVGTALLLFCIRAISDEKNMKVPQYLSPICVGFVVLNIGICFGYNCGYAINPARDFGPRLFTSMAGYGSDVFSAYDYWFYVPVVAPHIGAIIGSVLYDLFVGLHWPEENELVITKLDMSHHQFDVIEEKKPDLSHIT